MIFSGKPFAVLTSNSLNIEVGFKESVIKSIAAPQFPVMHSHLLLTLHISLAALIAGMSIFLFNKRKLQLKITIINFILIFALYGTMIYTLNDVSAKFIKSASDTQFTSLCAYPLILLALNFIAYRGIKKDIDLVSSADRLR